MTMILWVAMKHYFHVHLYWLCDFILYVCAVYVFMSYRLNHIWKIIHCINKNRNKAWHTLFKISMYSRYKNSFFTEL